MKHKSCLHNICKIWSKSWYHLSNLFAVNSVHLSMMLQFSNTWSLTIKNVNCSRLDRGTPWQAMAQLFQEIRNIFKSSIEKLWSTVKTVSTFPIPDKFFVVVCNLFSDYLPYPTLVYLWIKTFFQCKEW